MIEQSDLFAAITPSSIPIESGIPIPANRVAGQRIKWDEIRAMLDFDRMQIGDSFAVRPEWAPGADMLRLQNFVSGAACSYRKTRVPGSWAFTTRQMADGSVRCWRIDPSEAKGRGE